MKDFIKDVIKSFKSSPVRTVLMLLLYPLLASLMIATAVTIMVATLSVEDGIDWFKDAWS